VNSTSRRSHLQQSFRWEIPETEGRRLGEVMKLRRYQKGMGRQKVRANVHVSRDENKKRAQRGNLEGKGSLL
jgi:hypothetical protein